MPTSGQDICQACLPQSAHALHHPGDTYLWESTVQRNQAEKEVREGNRALSLRVNELQDDFNARQNEELSKLPSERVWHSYTKSPARRLALGTVRSVLLPSASRRPS